MAKRKSDGRLMLRESAMCPDQDKASFEDISRHKFFNTNNLWINLRKLKATLDATGGTLKLPLIKNKKTVNPRDGTSAPVFQLVSFEMKYLCFFSFQSLVVYFKDHQHAEIIMN